MITCHSFRLPVGRCYLKMWRLLNTHQDEKNAKEKKPATQKIHFKSESLGYQCSSDKSNSFSGKSLTQLVAVVGTWIPGAAWMWTFQMVAQWPRYSHYVEVVRLDSLWEVPLAQLCSAYVTEGDERSGAESDTVLLWSGSHFLWPRVLLCELTTHRIAARSRL